MKAEYQFSKLSLKQLFIHFVSVPGHAHSIKTGPGTSLCSCSGLSLLIRPHFLFLQPIPKQDQESFSAPWSSVLNIVAFFTHHWVFFAAPCGMY